jgi:uncharacterized protein (DUF1015 family)
MPDFRPFRALRYDPAVAGDPGTLLAPPFDVIDAEEQAALHARSKHNVVRLELGETRPDDDERSNRYTRAAEALAAWRASGAVVQDERPSFYVYVQEFEHDGKRHRRTAVFGEVRLEPWEAGSVLPHEETMAKPKEDRLRLLRTLRANVSPILMTLAANPSRHDRVLPPAGEPLFDATTPDGQHHALSRIEDPAAIAALQRAVRHEPFYVLDGHHRYETALAYRNEVRAQRSSWTGDEPENFVLAAVTTADDPGLLLLPIHRLVRPPSVPPDLIDRLARVFDIEDVTPKSYDGTALLRLLARLSAAGARGATAFGALGLEEQRLHLLTLRDVAAARASMPAHSDVWRALDVSVLEYAVLRETLGIEPDSGAVEYTEDASHALPEVEHGRWPLAFLLNATRIEQMIAVADAGERMPAKSTFFWPKLATGLVLRTLDPPSS